VINYLILLLILKLECDKFVDSLIERLYFVFICGTGVEVCRLLLLPPIRQLHKPSMIDDDDCGAIGEMNDWQRKPKYSEKTRPNADLFTTNPTCPDKDLNPGRRDGSLLLPPELRHDPSE
jgi:hypothetical protein